MSQKIESFRLSVTNGNIQTVKSVLGSPVTNRDGSQGILKDVAVPSGQLPPIGNETRSVNRVAVPAEGLV